MIRIRRPQTEPVKLAAARAAALQSFGVTGPASRKELGDGYKVAHDDLWRAQFMKCAYCEFREQSKRNDVEHFRPAMRADRRPGSGQTYGYWWLAFSWENLLFSCRNCNQSPAKLDQFPLSPGSEPLAPLEQPPGKEIPLLIDPSVEDGSEHIQFVRITRPDGVVQWRPVPRNGSKRGAETIRVCKLDRADLITLYTRWVEDQLEPELTHLDAAMATADHATIQKEWARACARLLNPSQVFVGLTQDVMSERYPPALRAQWQLALPK